MNNVETKLLSNTGPAASARFVSRDGCIKLCIVILITKREIDLNITMAVLLGSCEASVLIKLRINLQ